MNEIITRTTTQPIEYEFQKVAIQRKLITSSNQHKQFKRIEAGTIGENYFKNILNEFGQKHWSFMQNVWLHDFTDFECDYLLFTSHYVYVFEIKNYFGRFEYLNGQCRSRGVDITYNPINQAHNATIHLRNLLSGVPVRGVLVFIGEHNQVHIHDEIDYIDILCRNDIYQYIQDIIAEENQTQLAINSASIISILQKHMIESPYPFKPYYPSQMVKRNMGIFCARCGKGLDWTRQSYITCTCGFHEYRKHLIVRTICEYGILTYGTNFTVSDIYYLFQCKISRNSLRVILEKYFNRVPNQSILTFENPGRSITHSILFDKPNKIILHHN